MNPQALAKSSLLRILLALAVLLAIVFATVKQADLLLGKALTGAFGEHQSEYESVWFDWSGNVTARNVVLRPHDLRGAAELRFDRVWLETPGWSFFLRHAFDRDLQGAGFMRLHLRFGEATQTAGLEALLPEFGPVGPASAAMFEAAGCVTSRGFTHEQLAGMGLSIGPTSLELDQRLDGDAVYQMFVLDTPGSSRTQLERNGRLDAPRASLLDTRLAARIESERWRVRDQGFVPARNRHCARQAGIEPREFPERHIEALDRFMQRAGLAVDDNARAFYRRFVRSGGEMSFGGPYRPPLGAEESLDERDDGRALARMEAALERDTRAVPIVWHQVPVVGAPEPDEDEPAAAPDIRESTETVATTGTDAPAPTPPPTATSPAAEASMAAESGTTATPPAPTAPEATESPAPAIESPPSSEPATPPPAAAPPPAPPGSTPARPSTGPRIERAPPVTRRETLSWDELARHRGRNIRLWTVHNPPRTVELLDVAGDTARVRARLGGGQAEYTVQRSGFIKATLIR